MTDPQTTWTVHHTDDGILIVVHRGDGSTEAFLMTPADAAHLDGDIVKAMADLGAHQRRQRN